MGPPVVVPLHPVSNAPSRLLKRLERVLPDALFLETPKESFNDAVLFRRVGRDELLLQAIVPTGLAKAPTLEDQAVVATQHRGSHRTERPEALETGRLDSPFGLLCATAECELVADHFTIMAVDHGGQMRPTVLATGNMRHIHGPPFITPTGPTHPAPHPGARGGDPLMDEPSLLFEHAIDRLAIDDPPFLESQQHPEPPIAKRRMLLNQLAQALRPQRVYHSCESSARRRPM